MSRRDRHQTRFGSGFFSGTPSGSSPPPTPPSHTPDTHESEQQLLLLVQVMPAPKHVCAQRLSTHALLLQHWADELHASPIWVQEVAVPVEAGGTYPGGVQNGIVMFKPAQNTSYV